MLEKETHEGSSVMPQARSFNSDLVDFLKRYFSLDSIINRIQPDPDINTLNVKPGIDNLNKSILYSLLETGGKRFRPRLCYHVSTCLGASHESIVAWAAVIECVHTYSLIHDDLPSMDNDSIRRGLPTNHIKFGDAAAILAGDALFAEAFQIIAREYQSQPKLALELVSILSQSSGLAGMVGGQAIDLWLSGRMPSLPKPEKEFNLQKLHELKTGALIHAAVDGAALICEATPSERLALSDYGKLLGYAFQLADDIEDSLQDANTLRNDSNQKTLKQSMDTLCEVSKKAREALQIFSPDNQDLIGLIDENEKRAQVLC